jgi:hypothetical protein
MNALLFIIGFPIIVGILCLVIGIIEGEILGRGFLDWLIKLGFSILFIWLLILLIGVFVWGVFLNDVYHC